MTAADHPRVTRAADGTLEVHVPGSDGTFRVIAWNPPALLLARGHEVRTFHVVGAAGSIWIGHQGRVQRESLREHVEDGGGCAGAHDDLSSPMPGTVLEVLVAEGDEVEAGQRLMIIEAMKMETPLRAPHSSVVTRVHVAPGDRVEPGRVLVELEERE